MDTNSIGLKGLACPYASVDDENKYVTDGTALNFVDLEQHLLNASGVKAVRRKTSKLEYESCHSSLTTVFSDRYRLRHIMGRTEWAWPNLHPRRGDLGSDFRMPGILETNSMSVWIKDHL